MQFLQRDRFLGECGALTPVASPSVLQCGAMISFPNVCSVSNVLTDRSDPGSGSAVSNGPNIPNISCCLKSVLRLTITRTFWRLCYRLAINNRHQSSTCTWKNEPDVENCADGPGFSFEPATVQSLCLHGATTATCYSLPQSLCMGRVFDHLSLRTTTGFETTTQS